jgi:hypothetical protein
MMLIFANGLSEAEHWARGYKISRHVWRYVHTSDDVRGYYHCAVVTLPEWKASDAQLEAMSLLRAMGALSAR